MLGSTTNNEILENNSQNRIGLSIRARNSSDAGGGAASQESFVITNITTPVPTPPINDTNSTDLANEYFNKPDNIGFFNVLIERSGVRYAGFIPILNLTQL